MPRAATRRTSRCTSSFALLLAAAAVSATGDASSSARAGCPCRDFFSADGMYVRAIECHVWANADDFSDCAADQLSSLTERRACTVLRHDLPFAGAWSQQLCDELRGDAGRRCRVAPLGLTLRAPAPEQSGCAYAFDDDCDEPQGTGLCSSGTDSSDCGTSRTLPNNSLVEAW